MIAINVEQPPFKPSSRTNPARILRVHLREALMLETDQADIRAGNGAGSDPIYTEEQGAHGDR
jgi:hypothetical protein